MVGLVALYLNFPQEARVKAPEKPPAAMSAQVAKTAPDVSLPVGIGEVVPDFTLTDAFGDRITHRQADGPLFITLTATGCGDCLKRIAAEDSRAFELAQQAGVPVWNLLVYHPNERAPDFVSQYQPRADRVLADPTAQASVSLLGGSDSTCWLLLDKEGKLVYRAGVDPEALAKVLKTLP